MDVEGKEFSSEPISKGLLFERFILLSCIILPTSKTENGLVKLLLNVNDEYSVEDTIDACLGSSADAQFAIGSSLDGRRNAAFSLGELRLYNSIQNEAEKKLLQNYVEQKWDVK